MTYTSCNSIPETAPTLFGQQWSCDTTVGFTPNFYAWQPQPIVSVTYASTAITSNFVNQYYTWQDFQITSGAWQDFQIPTSGIIFGGSISVGPSYTPEEMAVWSEEARKSAEKSEAASKRAEELLLSLLNERQKETWVAEKMFEVFVGNKLYRLRLGHKVHEITPDGKAKAAYCIHPEFKYGLPACDVLVAQKLMLETDLEGFHKTANVWAVAA